MDKIVCESEIGYKPSTWYYLTAIRNGSFVEIYDDDEFYTQLNLSDFLNFCKECIEKWGR